MKTALSSTRTPYPSSGWDRRTIFYKAGRPTVINKHAKNHTFNANKDTGTSLLPVIDYLKAMNKCY
uniref:Uncharacterized protein n=1 Tax=Anguilla anguilla TaxID=7936 RepID=A0A0E9WJW2_ANGAN